MDPILLLSSVVKISHRIYAQAGLAKANQEQINSLSSRVQMVVSSISGLSSLPNTKQFIDSLLALRTCLEEIDQFIQKFSTAHVAWKFVFAGSYNEQFARYNQRLAELLPHLNIGLAAAVLIDKERDRKDQAADFAYLISQQSRILEQQEKILRETEGMHLLPTELERLIKKQMESFEAQIEAAVRREMGAVAGAVDKLRLAAAAGGAGGGAAAAGGGSSGGAAAVSIPLIPKSYEAYFDEIHFERKLAESEMGEIYSGWWKEQSVRVRLLDHLPTEEDRRFFIHEAQIMSRLHHEGIVPFRGVCLEKNKLALLTGTMEKGSLKEQVISLSINERLSAAQDLARALSYLHGEGILHGDIRLGTVLVNRFNQAKWSDFGLSKTRHSSIATLGARYMGLTVAWQAPESWCRGAELTSARDIYSFGLLIWSLFSTQDPYAGMKEEAIIRAVNEGSRPELTAVPEILRDLIASCWQAEPLRRPKAGDVVRALTLVTMESLGARAPSPAPRAVSPSGEALYLQAADLLKKEKEAEACLLYERAAAKGYVKAFTPLSIFALGNKGARAGDREWAKRHLEEAAARGEVRAMFNLGRMYEKGDGGVVDFPLALHWYQQVLATDASDRSAREKVELLSELLGSNSADYKLYTT